MFELIDRKTYRLLFVFALIGTLILTFSVASNIPNIELINDKLAHGLTFFVLTFLCSHAFGRHYGLSAVAALSLFGLLIEIIQYFLPWRSFSWLDWGADNIGIIGYDICHRLKHKYLSKP